MRTAHVILTAFLALSVGCTPVSHPKPEKSSGATGGPASSEFDALRRDYGDREDFYELCEEDRPIRELIQLGTERRWEELVAVSRPWLKQCPIDIDAEFVTALAFSELRQPEEADRHLARYRGLVKSVLDSGDGEAPETAYKVISVAEEYSILGALGYRPKSQSLIDGHIDALTVVGESGEETIYFDPAPHFRRLERAFERRGEPE